MVSRYEAGDFLDFFDSALAYIVELNRAGTRLVEILTQILVSRILTPFPGGYVDLQSPSVAGLSALVYNFDGGIYVSDEARMLAAMGDETFRVGSVREGGLAHAFHSPTVDRMLHASILECHPGCADCVFLPYCGSDPVYNWHTQRDLGGYRPTSQFCRRQMGLFRCIFKRLLGPDEFARELLESWAWEAVS
jgi:radical SAM protein with 4Fe4S-binding SPASM domain